MEDEREKRKRNQISPIISLPLFLSSVYLIRVAVGDFGGFLTVFDLERLDKPVLELEAHKGLINAIDGCGGLNVGLGACEIATAGKDGTVKIFDVRQREPVAVMQPEQEGSGRDCWAVAFGNAFSVDERVVVAGYDNGDLKLLDLKMNKIRWETNVGNGICSLEFDRKDIQMNKLAVGGLEANFRVFDMRTQHTEQGFASVSQKAHKSTVWTTRFLPQNREILASTGGNGTINLYKYSYPEQRVIKDDKGREMGVAGTLEQLATTRVSEHPIVSFDWHMDKMGLYAAGCIDQTVRVGLATKLQTI